MERIEIRAIEDADIETTVRMWRRSREGVQPELEARLNYSGEDDLKFFTHTLLRECNVWLAIANKQPVGFLAINADSVEQLYVEPVEQGTGVGTVLLDFAKEESPTRLQLHTHQANTGARKFYEKRGFRAVQYGISPAPENEPDVRYEWGGKGSEPAV